MNLVQLIIVAISVFSLLKLSIKFKRKELSLKEAFAWGVLWLIIAIVVLLPNITSIIALELGVGRGVDAVIYFSVIVIFYILFRVFIWQKKIERDITKIVRYISIDEKYHENSNKRKNRK
ncbi:MAG: DUF2304 domain-containing protein [Candidatus Berkelbacteria bacterium]|nr:DUF2304 domain-containing protein [Candidatus Berkelbacteria bacterium]